MQPRQPQILMCPPDFYGIEYEINPWMNRSRGAVAVVAHQQWMVRSYIVTFAFVLFRIVTDHIPAQELWGIDYADWSNAMIWPVWVMPLLGYEILLAFRRR